MTENETNDDKEYLSSFTPWIDKLFEDSEIDENQFQKYRLLADLQDTLVCIKCGKCCIDGYYTIY